jgi:hypothetical protein
MYPIPFIRIPSLFRSENVRKKAFAVLEAVELVGNPQGCPSGGGQPERLSTGAPNPQHGFRVSLATKGRGCYKRAGKKRGVATRSKNRYPRDMNFSLAKESSAHVSA